MPGRRYSTEQIVAKLREAERLQGQARASRWVSLHAHRHERTRSSDRRSWRRATRGPRQREGGTLAAERASAVAGATVKRISP
jgi:hypothetical protein